MTPSSVDSVACTVASGTTITVTSQTTPGLKVSNDGGAITADGVTVVLGPGGAVNQRAYVGAQVLAGGTVHFDGGVVRTAQVGAGQRGVVVDGAGSRVVGANASITLGLGATTASDNLGLVASNGGALDLENAQVTTLGGANGLSNHAISAVGADSTIFIINGQASTAGRASFGVLAQDGGVVTLEGVQVTTSGADVRATFTGSHALYALGTGSEIRGTNVTAGVAGAYANGARAESGGLIDLVGAHLTSGNAGSEANPAAAARATAGGELRLTGAGTTLTGGTTYGYGLSVDGAGSKATVSDATINATGSRASGVYVAGGGEATISQSSILATNFPAVDINGGVLELTTVTVKATAAAAAAVRARAGGAATITGGSLTTEGRDGIGFVQSDGASTLTNVTILTSGADNAMGVLADLGGRVTLVGGTVTTTGDGGVRDSTTYPHALTARNPGGQLTVTGTTLRTSGKRAFGATADDGGSIILSNLNLRTDGESGLGLFAVTEQVGAQFPASLTGDHLTIETFGRISHGAVAQARNDLDAELAALTISDTTVTTHGEGAQGLRAVLADYGAGPKAARGEARLTATRTQVTTSGPGAHGALVRDNPATLTLDASAIATSGAAAHGAVAQDGGLLIGRNATTVRASGVDASALFVVSEDAPISTARFTGGQLTNVSGPTIAMVGLANVSLTGVTVGGSGQWLKAGAVGDFQTRLEGDDPLLTGPGETPDDTPPAEPPPDEPLAAAMLAVAAPAAVGGLANLDASGSTLTGSALTTAGSVSNVTFTNGTVWNMSGASNLTNLVNDASSVLFAAPTGDAELLASYLTLTTVNYQGVAGTLSINTFLAGDDSPSDRLVIDGGTGSGTSSLLVANTGGLGAVTQNNGILVVDAINSATTAPGMLTLGGPPVVAGPYEYSLYRGGVGGSAPESWFLRS